MRIALLPSLLAPIREGVCFGGAEMAALALAEGLAERGHEVTLLGLAGSGGRGISIEIVPFGTPILRPGEEAAVELAGSTAAPRDPFPALFEGLAARAERGELDVLHLHLIDPSALESADRLARRVPGLVVVSTMHLAAVFPETTRVVRRLLAEGSPIRFTAPSRFAAESYDRAPASVRVVSNGVDLRAITPRFEAGVGRLAWAGRRSREKGLDEAIEIARRTGRTLRIAGGEAPEGGSTAGGLEGVEDLGLLARAEVPARLFADALATLVTSAIPESQSLVALESLASGTPVVAFAVGALPEVIEEGVTGFLVPPGDIAAAGRAVEAIAVGAVSRERCRQEAVRRFDHARTVEAYEAIYALAAGSSVP